MLGTARQHACALVAIGLDPLSAVKVLLELRLPDEAQCVEQDRPLKGRTLAAVLAHLRVDVVVLVGMDVARKALPAAMKTSSKQEQQQLFRLSGRAGALAESDLVLLWNVGHLERCLPDSDLSPRLGAPMALYAERLLQVFCSERFGTRANNVWSSLEWPTLEQLKAAREPEPREPEPREPEPREPEPREPEPREPEPREPEPREPEPREPEPREPEPREPEPRELEPRSRSRRSGGAWRRQRHPPLARRAGPAHRDP